MKTKSTPGRPDLTALVAPNRTLRADLSGHYWYAMMKFPPQFFRDRRHGTHADSSGTGRGSASQDRGCIHCHQSAIVDAHLPVNSAIQHIAKRVSAVGNPAKRPHHDGRTRNSDVQRRSQTSPIGDSIAKGRVPRAIPASDGPLGDVVVTEWDWANEHIYLHDTIATDKRTPTLNSNGLIYGAPEASSDLVPWLDPIDNKSGFIKSEYRDANTPTTKTQAMLAPSPYWGDEAIWDSHTNIHNPMFDEKGRLWLTARIRGANAQPAYCKAGSNHPPRWLSEAHGEPSVESMIQDPEDRDDRSLLQQHHLQSTRTTCCGSAPAAITTSSAGSTRRSGKRTRTTRPLRAGRRSCSTPTATASAMRDGRNQTRRRSDQGQADNRRLYGVGPTRRRSIWGSVTGFPGGVVRFDRRRS